MICLEFIILLCVYMLCNYVNQKINGMKSGVSAEEVPHQAEVNRTREGERDIDKIRGASARLRKCVCTSRTTMGISSEILVMGAYEVGKLQIGTLDY